MNPFRRLTAWLARNSRVRERRRLHLELIKINRNRAQDEVGRKTQSDRVTAIMNRLFALSLHGDKESAESRLSGSELPWPGLPTEGLRLRAAQEGGK
jgi:hypothetical protein